MPDKILELKCINDILNYHNNKGDKAQAFHAILVKNRNLIRECEMPDFIMENETEIIGLEHFQVDVLFSVKRKKAQSSLAKEKSTIHHLVEKYRDKELLDRDIENGTAMASALDVIQERWNRLEQFEYKEFIKNFVRVTQEHNDNCEEYRRCLNEKSNGRASTLFGVIEIPYLRVKNYIVTDKKGRRNQSLRGIPFTYDMLRAIQDMRGFDVVIVLMHSVERPGVKSEVTCYYFAPCAMDLLIREQRIKIFNGFDLPNLFEFPGESIVDFPREEIQINGEEIRSVMRVSPLNRKNKRL